MTSVDVKAEAEMSLSADITFAGKLLSLLASCNLLSDWSTAVSTSAAASWSASAPPLILYIMAASVVDVQVLPDPSLHAQLDGAVIWPCESLMKLLFCPGTQRGDDQSINDTGRSTPKGVLKHRERAK